MNTFEDIEAWQKARELTRVIYALSNDGPVFVRSFLCSLQRAVAVRLCLTQQPKREALKPERLKERAPSNSAFGYPRETHASLGIVATGFKT
jgi:hypothetical protein